jgi:inositol transport system ATP-binding protein
VNIQLQKKNEYALEMKRISKSFPGVRALDEVSLFDKRGTVHALMGENGAGKSTLMKILAGISKRWTKTT